MRIDPAKLNFVREQMDDHAVLSPCPCCGQENGPREFFRELIPGRCLDSDPELIRVFHRHYRCVACGGKFHVSSEVPERELMETVG